MRRTFLAVSSLAVAACAPAVTVTPAGSGLALPPRSADCQIEFFRTKPPERPYDEVAALHVQTRVNDAGVAQDAMRSRACALGADAVVVTRDYALGLMTGTAVSYRDLRQQHRLDAALEKAEADRAAAELAAAREAEAKARAAKAGTAAANARPPAGFVPAKVKRLATAYEIADRRGKELGDLKAGESVWVGEKPSSGWRRLWRPGERAAWIEDDLLELRGAAPASRSPAGAPAQPGTKVGPAPTDV